MELLVRWEMPRIAPAISLDPKTRTTLNRWVQAPSTAQALVLRSRIVLAAAAGHANQQIASDLELPQVTVGKWRRSFAAFGLDGLRDAPRSGRPPKHDAAVWRKVQTLACQQPESQGRWTVRTLARKVVPRLWKATCRGVRRSESPKPCSYRCSESSRSFTLRRV